MYSIVEIFSLNKIKIMTEKQIKKKLKEVVTDTYDWVNNPKGSDDFEDDLNIDYDELGDLKEPIIEEFGVSIKKREIKACYDINELASLIHQKLMTINNNLPAPSTNSLITGSSVTNADLFQDLDRLGTELYTKEDLQSGLKIIKQMIQEVGGAVGLFIVVGKLLTFLSAGILAPIGLSIAGSQIVRLQLMAVKAYAQGNAVERKQIRAAVSYIKGGFSLADRLVG